MSKGWPVCAVSVHRQAVFNARPTLIGPIPFGAAAAAVVDETCGEKT